VALVGALPAYTGVLRISTVRDQCLLRPQIVVLGDVVHPQWVATAYWDGGADVGPIRAVCSVSSPAGGRITRFDGDGLTSGTYHVQDPWGSFDCQAVQGK
jgi:hypothetical protein